MTKLQIPTVKKGKLGENLALKFLEEKKWQLLHKNWRYKYWEIDLIMFYENVLHFIEVKLRTNMKYGLPEEGVNVKKMNYLKKAAEAYCVQYPLYKELQFDLISILLLKNQPPVLRLIEDVYLY